MYITIQNMTVRGFSLCLLQMMELSTNQKTNKVNKHVAVDKKSGLELGTRPLMT